ncbi:MAG: hypothetical protein ACTTKL_06240 [Treponema sp.]
MSVVSAESAMQCENLHSLNEEALKNVKREIAEAEKNLTPIGKLLLPFPPYEFILCQFATVACCPVTSHERCFCRKRNAVRELTFAE